MIHHVVCFRFKAGVTAAQVAEAGAALLAMPARIPSIRGIAFGPNLAPSAGEWSHVLHVLFDDMEAVNAYAVDPEHVRVVTDIVAPIREARLAIDVEVP
ncbi:MAG: Dabb family protein [Gemmatimonadales bacterium]|nr:Dabb family protein [Gemmatimonadales bacterium]